MLLRKKKRGQYNSGFYQKRTGSAATKYSAHRGRTGAAKRSGKSPAFAGLQ